MTDIICTLETGVSKKTNKEYTMVKIPLSDDYEKVVFLDPPETALVKLTYNNLN